MRICNFYLALTFLVSALLVPITAGAQNIYRVIEMTGGGPAQSFLQDIRNAKRSGEGRAVIDEVCVSSCTLYTALIKDDLFCAEPNVKFYFHWVAVAKNIEQTAEGVITSYERGDPLAAFENRFAETQQIWTTYPLRIRRLILKKTHNRGLPKPGQELVLTAKELGVPDCRSKI